MIIRDARPDDLPEIVAIYNTTVASREVTADLVPVSVESRRAWFDEHNSQRRPLWVVLEPDSDAVIGWLSFSDFYGRAAYQATVEVSIYLAPQARGQGLGGALLTEAIARAPEYGAKTLLGFIFGHNVASLALFTRHQFVRWAHMPGVAELDGTERDLVILGRRV